MTPPKTATTTTASRDTPLVRAIFIAVGVTALALGIVGIVLPLLPTTPFVLLAAACFARGSERLHRWILDHRVMGPIVRDWREHRSMPPGVKPWAFTLMVLSFGVSIAVVDSAWHRMLLATLAIVLGVFLWRIPVRRR